MKQAIILVIRSPFIYGLVSCMLGKRKTGDGLNENIHIILSEFFIENEQNLSLIGI
jgi:hypothetical protein